MATKADTVQVASRVPKDLAERIDRYAAALATRSEGIAPTRARVIQRLLEVGLDTIDRRVAKNLTERQRTKRGSK